MNIKHRYNQVKFYIKKYGFLKTIKKVLFIIPKILFRREKNETYTYQSWMKENIPTPKELEEQRNYKFKIEPKISIIVPLYNTPVNFFEELVDCLINQTYKNWELCLADGSPEKNEKLDEIIKKDERIKYKFLNGNKGISGNTNEALELATGDYIGLLDHDDLLPIYSLYEIVKCINENPDVEFIYTDEDKMTDIGKPRFDPHFKPDFAIDTLRAKNYICHFSVFKNTLMKEIGGFRSKYDGSQDYDVIIRASEKAKKIIHIPKVLYHWRVHPESTAMQGDAKPYTVEAGVLVVQDHLKRVGLEGTVKYDVNSQTYKIDYKVKGNPKVTILIPNYNEKETLETCINSILTKTTYKNYEIVVIENNSTEDDIFEYYKEIEKNEKVKVLYYKDKGFNYSKIINFGVKNTDGEYIIQLNNDTEIITEDWLEKMLGMNQREDVGAVGVKLYYPDSTIQHAGVIIGIGGVGGHRFKGVPKDAHGYFGKESWIENLSAVTAACMMAKRKVYEEVGYMNEKLAVAFNDVDFCLKVREKGYLIIYNPFVELWHYESKSRGYEDTPEKQKRFKGEIDTFQNRWSDILVNGDPYYNKNLSLDTDQYGITASKVDY